MKENYSILIVDDEVAIRELLKRILGQGEYAYSEAKTVAAALRLLEKRKYDLILLDLMLPDGSGMDILEKISVEYRNRVVIVSGAGTIDIAVEAMKNGAFDFIKKPLDHKVLCATVRKALQLNQELDDFRELKDKLIDRSHINKIVYKSRNMAEVIRKAEECAYSNKTILITGETGTGKELIAHAIHNASERFKNPFITVNCSAIPITLAESELFGFDKGAFTGADKPYPGKFFLADKGTIFLDEIGDLHPEIQPKLLRVLENGEIFSLKSTSPKTLDIRVIAATNRNLEENDDCQFRRDLYFRIQQVVIDIPPLRKRKPDIIPLAQYFISMNNLTCSKHVDEISEEVKELLLRYPWPGNVRELKHTVEEIMSAIQGTKIKIEHLPSRFLKHQETVLGNNSFMKLQDLEKQHIMKILHDTQYNIQKSARLLGIGRPALYRKIEKYKIHKDKIKNA
ncbi:MAG TPA: sigma-54 dependent transcriptional regulator [Candidatus Deferrimicrobium sp.]|nr:sigma-54 dependent transcriptional regulator [Candidatus Deferrimicrobium sp.]